MRQTTDNYDEKFEIGGADVEVSGPNPFVVALMTAGALLVALKVVSAVADRLR